MKVRCIDCGYEWKTQTDRPRCTQCNSWHIEKANSSDSIVKRQQEDINTLKTYVYNLTRRINSLSREYDELSEIVHYQKSASSAHKRRLKMWCCQ